MKIKKNDIVRVITGKDKGKEGKILDLIRKDEKLRVAVEGVNVVKKHIKAKGKEEGGIVEVERPIDGSNVMLVCPKCKKTTRVAFKLEEGKKYRFCKKCDSKIE